MKKYIKPYMKRPIYEKIAVRILIALVLACFYNIYIFKKFVINATFFNYPMLSFGCICLMLGWFNYLKFDGIKINLNIDQHNREKKKNRKKKHKNKGMMDYTDEEIREDQELLEDEKTVCNMVANLVGGFIIVIPSLVLLVIELLR